MYRDSAGNLFDTVHIEMGSEQLELPYIGSDGKSLHEAMRVVIEGSVPLADGTKVAVGTDSESSIVVIGEVQVAQGALIGVTLPGHVTMILHGAAYMSDNHTIKFHVHEGRLSEIIVE